MSPLKRFLLVRREGAVKVEYWCVVTMRKILYFLGGSAREGGSAIYTPPTQSYVQGVSGGVLQRGRGVLLGRTTAYYLVEGTQGVNCIIAAGGKWLCRSIFEGKTDLGCGFWPHSRMHDPRHHATMSLKLGVGDNNVAKY